MCSRLPIRMVSVGFRVWASECAVHVLENSMRNKMKFWRRMAIAIKRAMVKKNIHEHGARYGRGVCVRPSPPVWRGGPPSLKAPSPLLSGLLKRQARL